LPGEDRAVTYLAALILATITGVAGVPKLPPPTVGMEGKVQTIIPGARLEAKPVDDKAPLIVRIASAEEATGGTRYDIRYIGLEPGSYDLKQYLLRADGSTTVPIPSIPVTIVGVLPENHKGQLADPGGSPLRFLGAYKWAIIAVGVLWLASLYPLIFAKRKRAAVIVDTAPPPPTLADRLQPLVQQAAEGKLSTEGKGQLERLLLSHWRERLQLADTNMFEALARLRQHREAGALLRALEDWLHRPPGTANVDVAAVLAPYRSIPAPTAAEGLA
jgi:hypothetical protein